MGRRGGVRGQDAARKSAR